MFELEQLGWRPAFEAAFETYRTNGLHVGRVAIENRTNYVVFMEQGEVVAEVAGRMLHQMTSPADLPKVGDWVVLQLFDGEQKAIIHDFLPRQTKLSRKVAGKEFSEQVLAANVDTVFVVQSLDNNFNPRRLERTLVMVHEGGAEPVVLLNKRDLCRSVRTSLNEAKAVVEPVPVLAISAKTGAGMRSLKKLIGKGRTYAFIGSSGVGKSTIINWLIGQDVQKTQEVRRDAKGRHTTTRRELLILPSGGCVIDTPGLRELQLWHADEGISETFADIETLAAQCHFRDCSHTKEIKCAVLAAVESGELSRKRYESYMKMQKELEFLESKHSHKHYVEQRKKDRELGKLYKRVLEGKRKRKRF